MARNTYKPGEHTPKDVAIFADKVRKMVIETFGTDEDGDAHVEFHLVDRRRFERSHFVDVPYDHMAETPEAVLSAILTNHQYSAARLDTAFKIWRDLTSDIEYEIDRRVKERLQAEHAADRAARAKGKAQGT